MRITVLALVHGDAGAAYGQRNVFANLPVTFFDGNQLPLAHFQV